MEDIVGGAGDPAFRPEGLPAAVAAMADHNVVAIEPDRRDAPRLRQIARSDIGDAEIRPITRQTAGDRDAGTKDVLKSSEWVCTSHT